MDAEISRILKDSLEHIGVHVLLGAGRATVDRDEQGLRVTLASGEILRPDKVLFAAGRAGNTEALGLAGAGVKTDERGRIVVDHRFETTVPGITPPATLHRPSRAGFGFNGTRPCCRLPRFLDPFQTNR
jgi:pyruvate/2-oxoglutarate dehydrogenase complex dihydrolipoamide dehydrogenase (E3) component